MIGSDLTKPHLLVVDDDEENRNLYADFLQMQGFECSKAGDAEQALSILGSLEIDVVLTDIVMPGLSGLELIKKIKERYDSDVIAFTGYIQDYDFLMATQNGANDFMFKPVNLKELLVRVQRVLRERTLLKERNAAYKNLNQQLLKYGEDLNRNFQQLKFAHKDLQEAYLETTRRLVIAAEYKDEGTAAHIIRMSRYCTLLAERLGLPQRDIENIPYASPMHDVGKIGIPDSILMKPGKLTDEEMAVMKRHATIGEKILSNSEADVIKMGAQIALTHHEKWNGEGYPLGLGGEKIPLCGRIAAVADVFDALGSQRPYKEALPMGKTLEIMKEGRGSHFDPNILDVLTSNLDDFLKIKADVDKAAETSDKPNPVSAAL